MVRELSPVQAVALGFIVGWQLLYLWLVLKKSLRVALALFIYFGLAIATLLWAGISPTTACALTVLLSIVALAAVAIYAPANFAVRAGAFGLFGIIVLVGAWVTNGMDHWRAALVIVSLVVLTVAGAVILFDLVPDTETVSKAKPFPLFKYTYWSQRAIEATIGDNPSEANSRFRYTLDQIQLPSISGLLPQLTINRTGSIPNRHDIAEKFEETFDNSIADVSALPASYKAGLLRGQSTIWGTFYGADGISDPEAPDRVAFITVLDTVDTNHQAPDDEPRTKKIAVCMFGSKDNLDGFLQDSHPQHVRGWAGSAMPAVIKWLATSEDWDASHWGETIGTVACKYANYQVAVDGGGLAVRRGDRDMSLAMRQDDTDWLAFIYHAEEVTDQYPVVPFDQILIGRPIWMRSRHLRVQTTDETDVDQIGDVLNRRQHAYQERWKRWLGIDTKTDGWPLYLYHLALSLHHTKTDI